MSSLVLEYYCSFTALPRLVISFKTGLGGIWLDQLFRVNLTGLNDERGHNKKRVRWV